MIYFPGVLAVFIIPSSHMLFNTRMNSLKNEKSLAKKLAGFQTAHIIKMAMLESVAMLAIIACLATFSTINFFVFGLAIILMAGSAPTTFKLTEHLNLSPDEVQSLEGI